MVRPLTPRERAVLLTVIRHGRVDMDGEPDSITADDRKRWAKQVTGTFAGDQCECGTCPSITLTDRDGVSPEGHEKRHVLSALAVMGGAEALILLFIDDDRLSYLEAAPMGDEQVPQFPSPAELVLD